MSLSARIGLIARITESVALNNALVTDPTVEMRLDNIPENLSLGASSTPDIEKAYVARVQLTAGAAELDLAALSHLGGTVNMTSKSLRFIAIHAAAANTDAVSIEPADSEGHPVFGASDGKVALKAGQWVAAYIGATGEVITDDTDDKIKLTSSDADAIVDVLILAG